MDNKDDCYIEYPNLRVKSSHIKIHWRAPIILGDSSEKLGKRVFNRVKIGGYLKQFNLLNANHIW